MPSHLDDPKNSHKKEKALSCELISEDDHDDVLRVRLRGTIRTDVLFISHIDIVEVRG